MGASNTTHAPDQAAGFVTVSQGSGAAGSSTDRSAKATHDADLAALARLPPVAPLMKQPSLRTLLTGRADTGGLPTLDARNVSALAREYASLTRHAALPVCEEQKRLANKMSAVEALCARVLYLMALRSTELASSVGTLRELAAVGNGIRESRAAFQLCVARAERLEALLPTRLDGGALS